MPVVPLAVPALEITGAGRIIVIVKVWLPEPLTLVAVIVTVKVPEVVGVPLITPVELLTLNPDGNPVAP